MLDRDLLLALAPVSVHPASSARTALRDRRAWYETEVYRLAGDMAVMRGIKEDTELQYGRAIAVAKG